MSGRPARSRNPSERKVASLASAAEQALLPSKRKAIAAEKREGKTEAKRQKAANAAAEALERRTEKEKSVAAAAAKSAAAKSATAAAVAAAVLASSKLADQKATVMMPDIQGAALSSHGLGATQGDVRGAPAVRGAGKNGPNADPTSRSSKRQRHRDTLALAKVQSRLRDASGTSSLVIMSSCPAPAPAKPSIRVNARVDHHARTALQSITRCPRGLTKILGLGDFAALMNKGSRERKTLDRWLTSTVR